MDLGSVIYLLWWKIRMSSVDCSLLMLARGLVCVVFVLLSSSPWYSFHRTSSRYIGPYKTPPLLSGASMEGENGLVGFPNSTLASASVCLRMLSSFQSYFVQHHLIVRSWTVSSASASVCRRCFRVVLFPSVILLLSVRTSALFNKRVFSAQRVLYFS